MKYIYVLTLIFFGIMFMIWCYLKTKMIGFLIFIPFIIILTIIALYKPLRYKKNKKMISKSNSIKTDLIIKEIKGNVVIGVYYVNGIEYNFRSQDIQFNIEKLLNQCKIESVPVCVLQTDPKIAVLDEDFYVPYIKERNEKANLIREGFTKKDLVTFIFSIGTFLILLSLLILLKIMYKNKFDFSSDVFIINYIEMILSLILILMFIYILKLIKRLKKINGIMVNGYIEFINYMIDHNYNNGTISTYYLAIVSYVYNNKVYCVKTKLSKNFNNKIEFLPVYIYPNYPKNGYVDLSIGYRK